MQKSLIVSNSYPDFMFILYPPVSGSCCIWKLSVLNPNGFRIPLPSYQQRNKSQQMRSKEGSM